MQISSWKNAGTRCLAGLGMTLLIVGIVGCGDDAEEPTRVRSMVGIPTAPQANDTGVNRAPVIEDVQLRPAKPASGRVVQAIVRATDPDGDATQLSYRWQTPRGKSLGEDKSFDTRGLDEGARLQLVVKASDGESESEEHVYPFSLSVASLEVAMVLIDTSNGTTPGSRLTTTVESTNESAGFYDTEIEWKVNDEVVSTEEELDTAPFAPGDIVIARVRIKSARGTSRAVSSPPVQISRADAPEIVSKPQPRLEGGLFQYRIRAKSKQAGATLAYEILAGPDGMDVDAKSGLVTWRPTREQRGSFDIEVAVKDQWGSGTAQSFAVEIESPAAPPASAR